MKNKFELIDYDVWGNKKDGYEVNSAFHTRQYYTIDDTWDDRRLIKELKKQGCIKKGVHVNSIGINGDEFTIYFEYKGRPDFELRKEE